MMRTATVEEAAAAALRGESVLDVRTAPEFASGHIPRSTFMPLVAVPLRLSELNRHAPIYVVCESGARAFQACQFLDQHGYDVMTVQGGMAAWRARDLPMSTGSREMAGG